MHLSKLPTLFVKGGEERKAFFTIQARELIAAGWVEKGTEEKVSEPAVKEKEETKAEEKPKSRRVAKKKVEES